MLAHAKWWGVLVLCVACVPTESPTPRPTFELSAPTLAASPTVRILTSDELYGADENDGQNNPTAAALPSGGGLPPFESAPSGVIGTGTPIQIVLEDGAVIDGEMYSSGQERLAGLLLIARDPDIWGELPRQLFNNGYTVVVMGVRASVPRLNDLGTMVLAVSELGTVDPARLAVIGVEEGADLALLGCAGEALCDGVVLVNPTLEQPLLGVLPRYVPRPMLLVTGREESVASRVVQALSLAAPDTSRVLLYDGTFSQQAITLLPDVLAWLGQLW